MRNIKYIILHHSATDYQANKDDIGGKLIGRTICDRVQEQWKKEFPAYKCDYHFIIGHTGEVFKSVVSSSSVYILYRKEAKK